MEWTDLLHVEVSPENVGERIADDDDHLVEQFARVVHLACPIACVGMRAVCEAAERRCHRLCHDGALMVAPLREQAVDLPAQLDGVVLGSSTTIERVSRGP